MPAPDTIHDAVKNALIKDGWTITHDPYTIEYGGIRIHADLAAERVVAAQRGGQKIAVESKSFLGPSHVCDLEVALGQYMLYRGILKKAAPKRRVFLAVDDIIYGDFFQREAARMIVEECQVAILVVDVEHEEIVSWKK